MSARLAIGFGTVCSLFIAVASIPMSNKGILSSANCVTPSAMQLVTVGETHCSSLLVLVKQIDFVINWSVNFGDGVWALPLR